MVATYTCHYLESNKPAQLSHDVFGHKKALFNPSRGTHKNERGKNLLFPLGDFF